MGKKIDAFILTLAGAIALYIYFYSAFNNPIISLVLSLISCLFAGKLFKCIRSQFSRNTTIQKLQIHKKATGTIMKLACLPADKATEIVADLIDHIYHARHPIEIIQLPVTSSLTQRDIFEAWKRRQGESFLVICASCRSDPLCKSFASTLHNPKVALLDSSILAQMLAECPDYLLHDESKAKTHIALKIRRILAMMMNRKNAPRCLLFATVMMLVYLLSANICYLLSSILLYFVAFVSLHKASKPAKLF